MERTGLGDGRIERRVVGGKERGPESLPHGCLDDGAVRLQDIGEGGTDKLRGEGSPGGEKSSKEREEARGSWPGACIFYSGSTY